MSVTLAQKATPIIDASGVTHTITYPGNSVSGNLLILALVIPNNLGIASVAVTSSSTSVGVAYGQASGGGAPNYAAIYYAVAGANSSQTWTVTLNSGSACVLFAYEWNTSVGPWTLDQATGFTNSSSVGTTATSSALTPANANELGFSLVTLLQNNPVSAFSFTTGGYAQEDTATQGGNFIAYTGDTGGGISGTPSTTATATWTGSGNQWGIAQLLFSSGTPPPTYTVVSSTTSNVTGTTGTFTLGEAVNTNDLLLVQWAMDNVGSVSIPNISDNVNNVPYTSFGPPVYYSTSGRSYGQSYVACIAHGTPTLTITDLSANNAQLCITHVTGFTGIPTLDQLATVTSAGSTSVSNTITTTHNTEWAASTTFSGSTYASTPTGWTSTFSGGNGAITQIYWQYVAVAGATAFAGTLNASSYFYNYEFSFFSGVPPTSYYVDGMIFM
jgi:hypothetical protein